MTILTALFAITALLYASVGFGGGSTYTALLLAAGVAVTIVPAISLMCNILVVSGGSVRFARARVTPWAKALPLVALAAPAAFLGGLTPLKEGTLVLLLAVSLLASAVALFFQPQRARPVAMPRLLLFGIAVGLGYLAGVVGIGGGIFLAPILHLVRWAEAKQVAATASLFILTNSLFGLTGQLVKGQGAGLVSALTGYWPLMLAVVAGGLIGSHIGVTIVRVSLIRRLTALLVGVVAVRLLVA